MFQLLMTDFMRLSRLLPLLTLLAACSPQGGSNAQTTQDGVTHSLGGAVPGLAQPNRAPPPDFATMKMSFSPIVKRVEPAVVNVFSQRVVRTQVDPFWQFFRRRHGRAAEPGGGLAWLRRDRPQRRP